MYAKTSHLDKPLQRRAQCFSTNMQGRRRPWSQFCFVLLLFFKIQNWRLPLMQHFLDVLANSFLQYVSDVLKVRWPSTMVVNYITATLSWRRHERWFSVSGRATLLKVRFIVNDELWSLYGYHNEYFCHPMFYMLWTGKVFGNGDP